MHAIDLGNLPSRSRIIVDEQAKGIRISWPLSKWRTSKRKRELQGNLRSLRALGEKRPAVTVSRRDVHELRIEVVRAHMHLYFKLGEKRFEIGEVLSEPEREWLHSILQKWLNK
jgi:hypothetical protein